MRSPISSLLFSCALLLAAAAGAAEQAGVSAAVRGEVALTRLQVAVGRQVVGGEPILLRDAIQSGQRSGMQILLLDETVFTIGPESELVIDEFVYDPKTNAGKLSAEITKGVFRFVSGKIAHEKPEDMNLKLPSGTLGVRGTMVAGRVDPTQKSSRLVLLGEGPENDTGSPAGAFLACNAGKCVRINRPGFGTSIDGPDSPPLDPFRFSQLELDELTQAVSDPQGWVQTAASENAETPPVATGPEEAAGNEGGDSRSASEVSGISYASGTENSDVARTQLRTLDGLEQATTDVAQFSDQTVLVNGREVALTDELPETCLDPVACFPDEFDPSPLPVDLTTYDQLSALASTGLQTAVYQRSGLGLIGLTGESIGSYDFFLEISPGIHSATLNISNLDSSTLGLADVVVGGVTDYLLFVGTGFPIPATFFATTDVTGTADLPCAGGCSVTGAAQLSNGNGRTADAALPIVGIITSEAGGSVPLAVSSGQQIRRP